MNRSQRRALSKGKNPGGLARLAELHHTNGQLDKAERKYREAIARDPDNFETHSSLGTILQRSGRAADATEHFSKAFVLSPKNATVVFNLAVCLASLLRFKDAAALYREAIALNPSFADAQYGLAFTLAQLREYDAAEHHYLEALKIDPLHWQARVNLGLALVEQGKVVEAFEQAEILAAAEQATGFPHKSFGILLARAGCPDGARHCFETHLALNPGDGDQIAMLIASVGGAVPDRASDRQIVHLYEQRARGWDKGQVGYRGHRLVAAALVELNAHRADTVIDAGCGTGMVGELLRAETRHLIGIDLSDAMLAQARQKNVYDELHRGDLVGYLSSNSQSADVIASAATLIHFGDLNPVFAAAAQCLRPGGLFVFTAFPNDDDPGAVAVGTLDGFAQGGCFRHGADYVAGTAAAHGFSVALLRREDHEHIGNAPITGLVVALRLKD